MLLRDVISPAPLERCGAQQLPVLSMTMHSGIMLQSNRFKKSLASVDQSAYKIVKRNQLVVGFPIDEGVLYIQHVADAGIMSPAYDIWDVDESKVNPDYLELNLHSPQSMLYYKTNLRGTTARRRSLPKDILLDLPLYIPDINMQKHIVQTIYAVRKVIAQRQRQLLILNNIIRARFVEMFGDETQFLFAPLQESVEEMFIGPFGSSLKNECFVPKEDGFCIVYEQKHAIRKTMNVETRYVNEKKYEELQRFTVRSGDIIVSCRGTIGETFVVPDNAPMGIMHPSIMKIRLKKNIYNGVFFNQLLQAVLKKHEDEANGSGVKMAITATALGQECFIIPAMAMQNLFADFVLQIDKSKVIVQKSLDKMQLLYNCLMQKYFGQGEKQ